MNRFGTTTRRLVATRIDGGLVVEARRPGPAGLSTARFGDGRVSVAVDTAEPDLVVSVTVDLPDLAGGRPSGNAPSGAGSSGDGATAAGRPGDFLLGGPVGEVLWWLLGDDASASMERWWPGVEVGSSIELWSGPPVDPMLDDPRRRAQVRFRSSAAESVGRLALATGEIGRRNREPGPNALALVEAAVLAAQAEPFGPVPSARVLLDAAARHLSGLGDDWLDHLGPVGIQRLDEHIDPWRGLLGGFDALDLLRRYDRAADHARRRPGRAPVAFDVPAPSIAPRAGSAVGVPPPMAPSAARPRLASADVEQVAAARSAEAGVGGVPVSVSLRADLPGGGRVVDAEVLDDHLVVHVSGIENAGLWLRAFRPGPAPTLLALAPFDAPHRWRSARAVVPRDVDPSRLLVDVTARPEVPWRSADGDATERAFRLGVDAARASRRDDPDAADRWSRCADAWAVAGDREREGRAARLADHEVRHARRPRLRSTAPRTDEGPLAVDLLDP